MLTRQDLLDAREQIQEDLGCILDGISEPGPYKDYDKILTNADQAVVDRFEVLFSKL